MSLDGKVLFGRDYSVVVAPAGSVFGLDVSELRISFKAKKTTKSEPNTCQVKIYNLAESSRSILEGSQKLILRLEAGYVDTGTTGIFLGQVRRAYTQAEGPDIVTTITTGDSAKEIQEARLQMSVGPGVPATTVVSALVTAIGCGTGNLPTVLAGLAAKGATSMFGAFGSAVSGNAARILTDVLRSAGYEWSIQDGSFQGLPINQPLVQTAVQLSPDTGLIGSPAVDFSASSKTKLGGQTVKAKCLIIPGLAPGRLVVMASKFVTGGFRIEEVEFEGDTYADPWYATLTLRALSTS
jgi:hypothetical protein